MRGWGEHIRARSAKSDFQTNAAIPGNCKANEIGRHRKDRSHYRSGWQSQKHKHCRRASCLRRCNTRGPEGMEVRTSENRHRCNVDLRLPPVNWWRTVVVPNNEYPSKGNLTDVGLASSSGGSASSPYHRGTEEKAEIVPGAGVVHLVGGDLVVEERNDERKGQDEPCHSPSQKPATEPSAPGEFLKTFGPAVQPAERHRANKRKRPKTATSGFFTIPPRETQRPEPSNTNPALLRVCRA